MIKGIFTIKFVTYLSKERNILCFVEVNFLKKFVKLNLFSLMSLLVTQFMMHRLDFAIAKC